MRRAIFFPLLVIVLVACGGGNANQPGPAAGPPKDANAPPDIGELTIDGQPLTAKERLERLDLDSARIVVGDIEAYWPLDTSSPLANPGSLDDVMAVLKTDQVTLFPGAIDYLKDRTDLDSLALYGQIELAWGETYMLLMEILMRVRDDFALTAEQLEQSDALDEVAKERLGWLYGSSEELALRIKALELVAIDHLSAGFDLAEQVMLNHADSYLGYRLAADYYRTLRDWENFELMRIAIEERNPESNGLMFLRAAAAMQAEGDRDKADDLYRKALAHDPHFVRAQVHLLIIQSDLEHTYRELLALEKLNPHHQFVALAGPAIKAAYAARKIEAALWLER